MEPNIQPVDRDKANTMNETAVVHGYAWSIHGGWLTISVCTRGMGSRIYCMLNCVRIRSGCNWYRYVDSDLLGMGPRQGNENAMSESAGVRECT